MKAINEIGNKYGKLTVIEDAGKDSTGHKIWKCRCECGNVITVRGSRLRNKEKQDCGCVKKHGFINEVGNRYGRLLVLKLDENKKTKDRHTRWICQCDCGNITTVNAGDLRQGKTKSCGCWMNESRGNTLVINEIGNKYGLLTVVSQHNVDNRKNLWKCRCDCGNEIIVSGPELRQGVVKSCGCLQSIGEANIQKFLQNNNIPYKKEYCFKDLISSKNGHPRFDFAIFNEEGLKCLIEYQGEQHRINKGEFGKQQREETDELKRRYCKEKNIVLFEIWYYENIEERLNEIFNLKFD